MLKGDFKEWLLEVEGKLGRGSLNLMISLAFQTLGIPFLLIFVYVFKLNYIYKDCMEILCFGARRC